MSLPQKEKVLADLDIDGDHVTEDDLESDSESVEGNVLAAV